MSTEDLWSTIWGKVVTNKIRDEILYNGEETEEEIEDRDCWS